MAVGTAVPSKSASGKFASDRAGSFIEELGDRSSKILIKMDREPAFKYLVKYIIATRPEGQTILEESPVRSSGSNCVIERSMQGLEGQLPTGDTVSFRGENRSQAGCAGTGYSLTALA